ncbi:MAG: DUF2203 domain-containing protein [Deltaproteobacteria bacterium]|nr:DUF2203 domain-containing protein [Deltaproteobacteria bacterium]
MDNVTAINRKRLFTLAEARALLPLIRRITTRAVRDAEALRAQLHALGKRSPRYQQVEQEYNRVVNGWAVKMLKLGCEVKGLWLVDFDNGEGYYCWRYPEATVDYYHTHEGGFTAREKIN